MKCAFKQCPFGGEVEKDAENCLKVGNRYYHKECHDEQKRRLEIFKLYNSYNPAFSCPQLNRIINDIIDNKKIKSTFLLFCVKYAIKNKFEGLSNAYKIYNYINSPFLRGAYGRDVFRRPKLDKTTVLTSTKMKGDEEFNFKKKEDGINLNDIVG